MVHDDGMMWEAGQPWHFHWQRRGRGREAGGQRSERTAIGEFLGGKAMLQLHGGGHALKFSPPPSPAARGPSPCSTFAVPQRPILITRISPLYLPLPTRSRPSHDDLVRGTKGGEATVRFRVTGVHMPCKSLRHLENRGAALSLNPGIRTAGEGSSTMSGGRGGATPRRVCMR